MIDSLSEQILDQRNHRDASALAGEGRPHAERAFRRADGRAHRRRVAADDRRRASGEIEYFPFQPGRAPAAPDILSAAL